MLQSLQPFSILTAARIQSKYQTVNDKVSVIKLPREKNWMAMGDKIQIHAISLKLYEKMTSARCFFCFKRVSNTCASNPEPSSAARIVSIFLRLDSFEKHAKL